jgi:phenylacetate-CoA ligase
MSIAGKLGGLASLFSLPLYAARRNREQWLTPAQLANLRSVRVRKLLVAARAAPYYRRILPRSPVTGDADSLFDDVPLLDKTIIREQGHEALLTAGGDGLTPVFTSGSTGEPAKFLRSPGEETEFTARGYRVFAAYGGNARDTILNVGRATVKPRSGAAKVLRDLGVLPEVENVFVAAPVEESVRTVREFKPRLITGYAIGLEKMAEYILEHNLDVEPPKAILCGAMDVTDRCRDVLEQAFRAPAMNFYVSNEFGVIGWECPEERGTLHINDDMLKMEIVGDDGRALPDGSKGEVVLTSLTLTRMPLIRYRTGDTAARIAAPCSCGRGLGRMTPVQGRTSHAIIGPDGQLFTTPTVAAIFTAANAYQWVRRFQVREQPDSRILILVEPHTAPRDSQRRELLAEMARAFGSTYEFILEMQDSLPLAPSGKYQYVVPLPAA